jgi:hypothetical protein
MSKPQQGSAATGGAQSIEEPGVAVLDEPESVRRANEEPTSRGAEHPLASIAGSHEGEAWEATLESIRRNRREQIREEGGR